MTMPFNYGNPGRGHKDSERRSADEEQPNRPPQLFQIPVSTEEFNSLNEHTPGSIEWIDRCTKYSEIISWFQESESIRKVYGYLVVDETVRALVRVYVTSSGYQYKENKLQFKLMNVLDIPTAHITHVTCEIRKFDGPPGINYMIWKYDKDDDINKVLAIFHQSAESCSSHSVSKAPGREVASVYKYTRLLYKNPGLQNLGNTCYMNSVLQCLTIVPWEKISGEHNNEFAREFFSLMRNMRDGMHASSLSPDKLKRAINSIPTRFSTYQQQDAHEFLTFILATLKEGLTENGRALLKEIFCGELENCMNLFCDKEHVLKTTQDLYTINLPVTIPEPISVENALAVFQGIEELDPDQKANCQECRKKVNCSMQVTFGKLPEVLILHLMKFDFCTKTKLDVPMTFPFADLKILNSKGTIYTYDLQAISNHRGSLKSGHYTAFVKFQTSTERSNPRGTERWFEYNDSSVHEADQNRIEKDAEQAYLLFYKLTGKDPNKQMSVNVKQYEPESTYMNQSKPELTNMILSDVESANMNRSGQEFTKVNLSGSGSSNMIWSNQEFITRYCPEMGATRTGLHEFSASAHGRTAGQQSSKVMYNNRGSASVHVSRPQMGPTEKSAKNKAVVGRRYIQYT